MIGCHLFVEASGPPGGGDELLKPRLLHPQRRLDVKEHYGAKYVERDSVKEPHAHRNTDSFLLL